MQGIIYLNLQPSFSRHGCPGAFPANQVASVDSYRYTSCLSVAVKTDYNFEVAQLLAKCDSSKDSADTQDLNVNWQNL